MAVFKCKMCGGNLDVCEGVTVCECEYCGTKQTVPSLDNEKKSLLFGRANRLRFACEFDKAAGIYESIVAEFPDEAEAYWGLVLCKYGIEYVDDPATANKIPTCHRSSFDSVFDDGNFEQVMENADTLSRQVYREEAKQIEELRKGIIEVSSKEEPYDIFICYKETDEKGDRTLDSVIAQDVYKELVGMGYRVFFSRITLEDKLGQEYEPYIFAALNSAKVMLAFGTCYDYYNAVWVKNEWSRFLQLIEKGEKKTLIPCYKNIDAYDMPKEFAKLQAQDMGKVGAIQDLLRGIEKIIPKEVLNTKVKKETFAVSGNDNAAPLLKRAFMFLEDGDFASANEYAEKVLDNDPENAEAYLVKLMVDLKAKKRKNIKDVTFAFEDVKGVFENNINYQKIMRFGNEELKKELNGYIEYIIDRNRNAVYNAALKILKLARNVQDYDEAFAKFSELGDFKNSKKHLEECKAVIEKLKLEGEQEALLKKKKTIVSIILSAVALLLIITIVSTCFNFGDDAGKGKNNNDDKVTGGAINDENTGNNDANNSDNKVNSGTNNSDDKVTGGADNDNNKVTGGENNDDNELSGGNNESNRFKVSNWKNITAISASGSYTVGLRKDGTVVAVGDNFHGQCNVSGWTDIVAISTGGERTVGLKKDGTVVAVGLGYDGRDVSAWNDIVAISAGAEHTVGLKKDGTVVAVGSNGAGECNVSAWTDIVAISAGGNHTIGLRKDGTVVVTGWFLGDVSNWTDIIAISAGGGYVAGLKSDGTVIAEGYGEQGQCNVEDWTDIIAIDADDYYTIGLKKDGTVVAAGWISSEISNWNNIVAIDVGFGHAVGLKKDGTVVAVG